MMGANPEACHLLNISLYLACAKEGAAFGQQLKIRPLSHDAPSKFLPPSAPAAPLKLQLHSSLLPLSWLPRNLLAPNPTSSPKPSQRRCLSFQLLSSLAEAALKAMVWVVTSTSCYVTLYFTMLVSPFISPSSPLSIHQCIFCSDIFCKVHCAHQYISPLQHAH